MMIRWMAQILCVVFTTGLLSGCGGTIDGSGGHGVLAMPLTGQGSSGDVYQLNNGTFIVDGPTSTELNSDDEPDSDEILVELREGNYSIRLLEGWSLSRNGEVVVSELISEEEQLFRIMPEFLTMVAFRFRAEKEEVVFGEGHLQVKIEIEEEDCIARAEICDGIDNDCDGQIDEDSVQIFWQATTATGSVIAEGTQAVACDENAMVYADSTLCGTYGFEYYCNLSSTGELTAFMDGEDCEDMGTSPVTTACAANTFFSCCFPQ